MKKHFLLILLSYLLLSTALFAQQSAVFTHEMADFQQALRLYENKQFAAAQNAFLQVSKKTDNQTVKADCAYYVANAAIRLNQQNAENLMEKFVAEHPTSNKRNRAYMDVADYYFEMGKYPQAKKWYTKVDQNGLSKAEKETFDFNNGYVAFKTGNKPEAQKYFNRISNSKDYGSQAKYYLGYIAYEGDDYSEANQYFEAVQGDEKYAEGLSYYQADMNFKLGNFKEAISLGKEQYGKSNAEEKSQLSKIIGESYFNLGEYAAAIPYLKEYRGTRGKWNNTDYYQLGYAYYKQGDYSNAIAEFNKIISGKDDVAQNAYYHLAESYLQQGKKQQALNAFKNASEMGFSPEIREDALYNYAKLGYEIGNPYQSVPQVFLTYLEDYPKSQRKSEMENLLVDSYISSKNFKDAMELLERNKGIASAEVYQKVAFYRGLELYDEGDFQDANAHFIKSLRNAPDAAVKARATYWKAETEYRLGNFSEAISDFNKFKQLPSKGNTEQLNLPYALGYAHFSDKNYESAISQFESFVSQSNIDSERKKDAYLRLGDSYFVASKYWPAMENYEKAIAFGGLNTDYAAFQKAISYGFVDRVPQKIESLKAFVQKYTRSSFRDDALYELGNTYLAANNTQEALSAYDELIKSLPQSSFVPKALLRKGLIFNNADRYTEALSMFKRVANDFPSSAEAVQAVATAKLIYIAQGRVDDYALWVNTLDFVEIEDAELDEASYLAAEKPYLENNPQAAKPRLEKYINDFPNGIYALNANFYLAQILYNSEQKENSLPYYEFIISRERNEFSEQALTRVSLMYLENLQYNKAITTLKRLEIEAVAAQNILFAETNLMKSYYELKDYPNAVRYAEKVLANENVETTIKNDARVIVARSAVETGNLAKAKTTYAEIQKTATGRLAAEALYYDAYFKNKEGKFEDSNKAVQKLAKDFAGFKEFGAKGLVIMAKNFYALKDAYQATYILENVISNFAEYPEVVAEARNELRTIKEQEAKTNASVETE